jgi:hypothetical protein
MIGGGVAVLLGTGAEGVLGGIGIRAAQVFASEAEFETALTALKAAGVLALAPFTIGGALAGQAVSEGGKSEQQLNKDLADCEKQFPGANHSGAFLTL